MGDKKKKKFILFLFIHLFLLMSVPFFGFGSGEIVCKDEEAVKNHPDFVKFTSRGQDYGNHYTVILTDNGTIEFENTDSQTGGGFYAAVYKIGEYQFYGHTAYYDEKKRTWKNCGRSGAYFIDLSQMLGVKIETMADCIDNYDKIYELAKLLAQEQYKAGYDESVKLQKKNCLLDSKIQNEFPYHFALSENRKSVVYILAMYEIPQWLWNGVKDNDISWCKTSFGENWQEKLDEDLPKIRKSLGLE